ncbi:MAG: error-prone DNA polymerase [Myxococcota bacterium]|nr:error-prone DNA polymerase [Myxococcota bacterium]
MASYVPLWCKSNFSFLEGASHPDELVEHAHELGLSAMALTDRDGVYGIVRAHSKAHELGLKLIVGSELSLDEGCTLVALVQNRKGYGQLCQLISQGRLRCPKGQSILHWEEILKNHSDLILLVRDPKSFSKLGALKECFGDRLYLMVARHREAIEANREATLRQMAHRYNIPTVASHEVLYHTPSRQSLQDVLTCIRHGKNIYEIGRLTHPNHEHSLKSPVAFEKLFADDLLSIDRTREVASRCQFSLNDLRYRYPSEKLPSGQSSLEYLRDLSYEGARKRYGSSVPGDVFQQLKKELQVIEDLEYSGYFLTMYEIVQFCQAQNILCQGRGSAANSVVCYCLQITAVDPIRLGLLFERFISKERAEPPDIDLDIEHDRREEVIQHVYEKYGRTHAAMVATIIRYRRKSAIRDVGKALKFSETALEKLSKISAREEAFHSEMIQRAGLNSAQVSVQKFLELTEEILDFPRHLSIHPGGFLLGHEPINTLVPIENGTMADRSVIQWDKDDLETLKLFKLDLLGLGALNVVHRSFDLIAQHYKQSYSLATVPPKDQATYDMICKGDTVGVFQIESRAQMSMLPRLRPRQYYDLVIEISLVRPGPITGGMVHPYLRRRNGEEPIDYPHPTLIPVLKKTLGIPLFQEQVMRLAVVAADYTPGEADQLRRDMAAWKSSGRIERHRQRLIARMHEKGIERQFAERVFEQIRGFGEYGFPESHAASFALIAYATAWLKRHYPAAFLCGLLNAQPMGFYSPATLIEDAKRHQVEVLPICVQRSQWECTLEKQDHTFAVRMGLCYVRSLSSKEAQKIIEIQSSNHTMDSFMAQVQLNEQTLRHLNDCGAFECFHSNRRAMLWEIKNEAGATALPFNHSSRARFPSLTHFEKVRWDYENSFHSTRGHPLEDLRATLQSQGLCSAHQVQNSKSGKFVRYAGLVICRQRPGTAGGVVFLTLEDETGFVNVVVWQNVFEKYSILAKTASFLGVSGKLQVDSGVVHLVANSLWHPKVSSKMTHQKSRDFC